MSWGQKVFLDLYFDYTPTRKMRTQSFVVVPTLGCSYVWFQYIVLLKALFLVHPPRRNNYRLGTLANDLALTLCIGALSKNRSRTPSRPQPSCPFNCFIFRLQLLDWLTLQFFLIFKLKWSVELVICTVGNCLFTTQCNVVYKGNKKEEVNCICIAEALNSFQ